MSDNTKLDFTQSFDGLAWAKGFAATMRDIGVTLQSPHVFGPMSDDDVESLMLGWFCNAIMRGYDEAQRRIEADRLASPGLSTIQEEKENDERDLARPRPTVIRSHEQVPRQAIEDVPPTAPEKT